MRMDDGYLYLPHRDHFIIPVLCEKGDIQDAITSNHTNHNMILSLGEGLK